MDWHRKVNPVICKSDILVDQTPSKEGGNEQYQLKRLQVWNLRKQKDEDLPKCLIELDDFLNENRRAFIFCSPPFADKLCSFSTSEWDELFKEINKSM